MNELPDGSGFFVGTIEKPHKGFIKTWIHKLFFCPTFWKIKPRFQCPICKSKYRCYWDGNDIENVGINVCGKCEEKCRHNT